MLVYPELLVRVNCVSHHILDIRISAKRLNG